MVRKTMMLVIALLSFGACVTASGTADESSDAAVQPAGRYEVSLEMRGETRTGTLRIAPTGSGFGGELQVTGLPAASVTGARASTADRLDVDLRLPEGPAALTMNFGAQGRFTGELLIGNHRVPVRGRRLQ